MTEEGPGIIGAYEDEDGAGKLHVKITNQAATDRTYQVKIWYLKIIAQEDLEGYVSKTLFDANSILVATDDNTPAALEIQEDRILGRITGGAIAALTGAQVKTIVGNWDERYYTQTEVDTLLEGYVAETLFDANTILVADEDDTPLALTVAEQRILGRITGGAIAALTGTQVKTIVGDWDERYYTETEINNALAGYIAKTLFDANTILAATDDNTPAALTVAEQRILGRITGGAIAALTGDQVKTIVGNWDERYYTETEINNALAGYIAKTLFDANTILAATDDNTPAALTVAEQRIIGRKTGGAIAALTAAEAKGILGFLADLVDDTEPKAGGEFDFNGHSAGWASWNSYTETTPAFDLRSGNNVKHTSGAGNNTATVANNPSQVCSMIWLFVQDGTGGRSWTLPTMTWFVDEPTWTDGTANQKLYLAVVWNGSGLDVVGATTWKS